MPRRYVRQLADGESVEEVFLVSDKQLRANRNGNLYLQADLRDRSGVINARLWNASENQFRSFDAGDFVRARGKVQLFQGTLQIILSGLERVEPDQVELSYRRAFAYTDEGQLLGHITIGVEMVTEKAAQVPQLTGEPFPHELLLRIKHMILSHHGQLDFGSPVLPMTPEAIMLASMDNLDAKVHTFTRDIREDRNATSAWTPYSQAMQRRLYKGGVDGSEPMYSPTLDIQE